MNWWSKYKKFILVAVAGVLVLAIGMVVALMARVPIACTLVGCSGGLTIEIADLPASANYQISISFPSGETRTLTCGSEAETNTFDQSCSQTGAYFRLATDVNPPKEITVTVEVNGKSVTQVFNPKYEKFQPNGTGCSPICYNATLKMNFPQ
jgi:hypothetical protein